MLDIFLKIVLVPVGVASFAVTLGMLIGTTKVVMNYLKKK